MTTHRDEYQRKTIAGEWVDCTDEIRRIRARPPLSRHELNALDRERALVREARDVLRAIATLASDAVPYERGTRPRKGAS